MTDAVRTASENRLDLMNRRGFVMDARRQLEVAADALEANLDLVVEGELSMPPLTANSKPFAFRARDSRFRAGLGFTTPLDRRAERNDFRMAQIAYQRARRGYVAAEDQIGLEVRQSVRTLEELSHTIVLSRRRLQYSARELDLAETQADLAQRGLSLTTALRGFNHAQDDLIEVWLDYETTRLNLFRDVGTMQIDERGFWQDPFYQQMLLLPDDSVSMGRQAGE
jgi:outer membrane protein TolC